MTLRASLRARSASSTRAPIGDELACRADRREIGGGARRPDPAADRQPPAAPSEVAPRLGRLPGLVPGPRAEHGDPLRQLRPGPRRQTLARLPAPPRQRLVPAALRDPPRTPPPGGARIRDDRPGLARRHLGRRCPDRA